MIIGAVIDVEFPRDAMPRVYDALKLVNADLTLEVQQQLGDGVVRNCHGFERWQKRGMEVTNTGARSRTGGQGDPWPSYGRSG